MFIFEKNPKNLQKPVEYTRFDGMIFVEGDNVMMAHGGPGYSHGCFQGMGKTYFFFKFDERDTFKFVNNVPALVKQSMVHIPSFRLISTGFWRFFGFFSKMNMTSP